MAYFLDVLHEFFILLLQFFLHTLSNPLDREMGLLKKYYWMLMKCLALLHFPITEAKQVFACR